MKTEIEQFLERSSLLSVRKIGRFCMFLPDVKYVDMDLSVPFSMMERENLIKRFETMLEWKTEVIYGFMCSRLSLHLAYSRKFHLWKRRLKPGAIVSSFQGVELFVRKAPFRKDGQWKIILGGTRTDSGIDWEYSLYDLNPSIPVIRQPKLSL